MTSQTNTPPIAITMGDPAGIGPELIAELYLLHPDAVRDCVVVGDVAHIQRAMQWVAQAAGVSPLPVVALPPAARWDSSSTKVSAVPVVQVALDAQAAVEPITACVSIGQVSALAGAWAAQSVVVAAKAALQGHVRAVVTAPLHKEALKAAGVQFPGHTELLQSLATEHVGCSVAQMPVRMMLANPELRTVLHSIHISLRDAITAVCDQVALQQSLSITRNSLKHLLGREPVIAVAGLNPHAGEGGLFGQEEISYINPAVAWAQSQGWLVSGAWAPDTVFMRARRGEFDVVLAMYHDQGLIPVKYLGVDEGVNVTLGLPFVRTSPDHGTAFDIAGSAKASAQSLLNALRIARQLTEPVSR